MKLDRVQLDPDADASLSATSESTSQALLPDAPMTMGGGGGGGGRVSSSSASASRRASPGRLRTFGFGRRADGTGSKSSSFGSSLNVRRFSTDSIISERLGTIGRRLSRDAATSSPPDLSHHFETFGKGGGAGGGGGGADGAASSSKFDTYSGKNNSKEQIAVFKCDTYNGKLETSASVIDTVDGKVKLDGGEEKPALPVKTKKRSRRSPLNLELYESGRRRLIPISERVAHGLAPPFLEADNGSALLRDKLHEELRLKYGQTRWKSASQSNDAQGCSGGGGGGGVMEGRAPMPVPSLEANGTAAEQRPGSSRRQQATTSRRK